MKRLTDRGISTRVLAEVAVGGWALTWLAAMWIALQAHNFPAAVFFVAIDVTGLLVAMVWILLRPREPQQCPQHPLHCPLQFPTPPKESTPRCLTH